MYYSRKILAVLLSLGLILALCLVPIAASANADSYFDPYLSQGHSKHDIITTWESMRPSGSGSAFVSEPVVTGPDYQPGELSQDTLNNGIRTWNFIRWLAGLESVTLTDEANSLTAKGALLNAINNVLSHSPNRPDDLPEDSALWQDGNAACKNSNIFCGNPTNYYNNTNLLSDSVRVWLNDSDENHVSVLGHRRWMLYPQIETSGFGAAYNDESWIFTACQTLNPQNRTLTTPDRVCWPAAGYFPIEFFSDNSNYMFDQAWSVSLGPNYAKATSGVSVTMTETDDGSGSPGSIEEFTSLSTSGTKIFTINTDSYGTDNCVIFRPETIKPAAGKSYHITITGLQLSSGGQAPNLEYDVSFFSLNEQPPEPTIVINTQPAESTTVIEGEISGSLSVSASVSNGTALFYQWYQNSSASNSGGDAISGATEAVFDLPGNLAEGTYFYYCLVSASGADDVVSTVATVSVLGDEVAVTGVSLDSQSKTLDVGDVFYLVATVAPADATNKAISWSSSDSAVATVDTTGRVEAIARGSATITVRTADGDFTADCLVTVRSKHDLVVEAGDGGITTGTNTGIYYVGEALSINAEAAAECRFNHWEVTGLTLSDNTVNPLAFAMPDNDVTVSAVFDLSTTVHVSGVSLNAAAKTLDVGDSFQLVATVLPANADNKSVTWATSDARVATVDSTGLVTAKSIGEVSITVVAADGGYGADCVVTVRNKHAVKISSIGGGTTTGTTSGTYYVGEVIAVRPVANTGYHFVNWTVTGVSVASDTAVPLSFTMPDSIVVIVAGFAPDYPVTNIRIDPVSSASLAIGKTLKLSVTIEPGNATDPTVSWSSSNTAVATVDENGLVTALRAGRVTITATSRESGLVSRVELVVPAGSGKAGNTPGTGDAFGQAAAVVGLAAAAGAATAGLLYVGTRRRRRPGRSGL